MHSAPDITLRHFLVEDSSSRSHPLYVPATKCALVSEAVAMVDAAGKDISDGYDAAMWMPGEAGKVVVRVLVSEIVEEEKGVEFAGFPKSECATQVNARAFNRRLGLYDALDGSY
jgi:hypothetical protein